jgi:hypothetical protein
MWVAGEEPPCRRYSDPADVGFIDEGRWGILGTVRSLVVLSSMCALSGCTEVATCGSVETIVTEELGALASVAVHMSSGDDPNVGGHASVEISLAQLGGDADCGFVVYRVDGVADPADVPDLDDGAAPVLPPGAVLLGEGRLPPAGGHRRHVAVEAFLSGGRQDEDDPVDMTVVAATCSHAAVEAELDLRLLLCQPGDEGPQLDPSTSFRRLW